MKTLMISLILCLSVSFANATSWRVNSNPAINADFATFEEAHDAASPGDTIYVEGAGYNYHYGEVEIDKKLIVIGPGYFLLENDSTQANQLYARFRDIIINPSAAGTEIYGITLEWGPIGSGELQINASNVLIARNRLHETIKLGNNNIQNIAIIQNFGTSISGSSGYTADNIIVTNNYLSGFSTIGGIDSGTIANNVVRRIISVSNSNIINNIVYTSSASNPLGGSDYGEGNYVAYNLISGSLPSDPPGPGNIGDVDMSQVFVDFDDDLDYSTDGRWQLDPDGPAVGAGEDGVDCGMFGGPTPYVLSGLAPIPRIYEATVPPAGSSESGLPVTIKVKSQN